MDLLQQIVFKIVECAYSVDSSEYVFSVEILCGRNRWKVTKSLGDFHQLSSDLLYDGLLYFPSPKKSLPSVDQLSCSNQDPNFLADCSMQVKAYIEGLMCRPDIATSAVFLEFFNFYAHIDVTVTPIESELLELFLEQRLSVSCVTGDRQTNLLFVGFEDRTDLCRLGKIWSLVEPDEIGAIHVLHYDITSGFSCLLKKKQYQKIKCLVYDEQRQNLFAADDGGSITVYMFNAAESTLLKVKSIEAHTASVIDMCGSSKFVLSIGFDKAMRLIDLMQLEIVCGGRLNQRLQDQGYLTACALDVEHHTAFIGTSFGGVLVYGIGRASPVYLQTICVAEGFPISVLKLFNKYLFIGVEEAVLCYSLEYVKNTLSLQIAARCNCDFECKYGVCCLEYLPQRKRLLVGYEKGLGLWSLETGECVYGWDAHDGLSVLSLYTILDADILFTGGEGGDTKMWKINFQNISNWHRKPTGEITVEKLASAESVDSKRKANAKEETTNNEVNRNKKEVDSFVHDLQLSKTNTVNEAEVYSTPALHCTPQHPTSEKSTSFLNPLTRHYCTLSRESAKDFKRALDGF